jgi:heat shock protein HslJ
MRLPWSRSALLATGLSAITACTHDAQPTAGFSPVGNWVAEDIMGAGVIDNLQTTLSFMGPVEIMVCFQDTPDVQPPCPPISLPPQEINVTGFGGCNRYSGSAMLDPVSLSFGAVAATKMACLVEAANNQETRFFEALTHVTGWREENDVLYLTDTNGTTVIRLSRLEG